VGCEGKSMKARGWRHLKRAVGERSITIIGPVVGVIGLVTTSLTTSAVSRYLGLFFHVFEHTSQVSAPALVPFEGSNDAASMICVQPNGSARFHFHQFGGVAHQTSLRSRSIMMTYSNSPPFGEASSLFSCPVTAMQDHCCNLAFSHGLPRTAAAVRGGRTRCSQSGHVT
jgi:hypothetical protein